MTEPKSIEMIRQRIQRTPALEAVEEIPLAVEPCGSAESCDETEVPAQLANLFSQRQTARDAVFRPIPHPGQIVRIGSAKRGDEYASPCTEPLAVLLDAPIVEGKWRGWMVGRDPEYATEWDLILGPEEDPRDPQCEVVQIWNPVTVTLAEVDRVLAELSGERLSAARMFAHDFEQKLRPASIPDSRIGVRLARELSDGTGVVTGSHVSSALDVRAEYNAIYREFGIWISLGGVIRPIANELSGLLPFNDVTEHSLVGRAFLLAKRVLAPRWNFLISTKSQTDNQPVNEVETPSEPDLAKARRELTYAEEAHGIESPLLIDGLIGLARLYRTLSTRGNGNTNGIAEALSLYKRALVICENAYGPNSRKVADVLMQLIDLSTRHRLDADLWIKRLLELNEILLNPNNLFSTDRRQVFNYIGIVGNLFETSGRPKEFQLLCERSIAISEKLYGPNSQKVAEALLRLAEHYLDTDRQTDAEHLFKQALSISESTPGLQEDYFYWRVTSKLIELYESQNRFEDAEPLYRRKLEKGCDPHEEIDVRRSLANIYRKYGRYAEVEYQYDLALDLVEKGYSSNRISALLADIAEFQKEQGHETESDSLLKILAAIKEYRSR